MRHLALTLPAPANRACLVAAHRGRSREIRSLLSAIERLARNRSQTPKSRERTQSAQVAGFPQRVVEGAIGTKSRNESYTTHVDVFDGQRVLAQDPASELERRMSEFEERLRRDPKEKGTVLLGAFRSGLARFAAS